jgi:hypothetical protein
VYNNTLSSQENRVIQLGISSKNSKVHIKYLGGLHIDLRMKVIVLKPKSIDQVYMKA